MPETITKQYTVYTFDELSEEAKQTAIEKLYDINIDYDWWQDDALIDLSTKECKARHITEYPSNCLFAWKEIYFDLDRNQHLQFKNLVVHDDNVFRKFLRIHPKLWQNCQYHFENSSSSWKASNTELAIDADFEDGRDFTPKQQAIVDRAVEIFSDKIHEGWTMLRKQFEYLQSEEAIIETIKANEYQFTEDGRLFGSCC